MESRDRSVGTGQSIQHISLTRDPALIPSPGKQMHSWKLLSNRFKPKVPSARWIALRTCTICAFVSGEHLISYSAKKCCATWIRACRGHLRNQSMVQPENKPAKVTVIQDLSVWLFFVFAQKSNFSFSKWQNLTNLYFMTYQETWESDLWTSHQPARSTKQRGGSLALWTGRTHTGFQGWGGASDIPFSWLVSAPLWSHQSHLEQTNWKSGRKN